MAGQHLRVMNSTAELRSQASSWDRLWQQSSLAAPSARANVVALWVDTFAPEAEFRCFLVEQQGRPVAALPLVGKRFLSVVNAAKLPCNMWAASGDLLIDHEADVESALEMIIGGLAELPWGVFVFEQISFEQPGWQAFLAALRQAGWYNGILEQHRVGQVEISGDWKAYEATRKSRHRQRRRRNARMLEKCGVTKLTLHRDLAKDEVSQLFKLGCEIEERSWKSASGTTILQNTPVFDYYLREAEQLAEWGQLELAFLHCGERPIAFCYGWNAKGARYCVKVGYDHAFAKYGPGQQLIMRLLEQFHADEQCALYDFHGRLVPWTESWITRDYPVGRLVVSSGGLVNRGICGAYTTLHPVLKRLRRRLT